MATITYLTTIQFDFGASRLLADELARVGIKRPLFVTDPGLVKNGLFERVRAHLPAGHPANTPAGPVYAETPANPTERAVLAALAQYRAEGCDGLVAVGGGSPIDLAKAVAVLASHDGPLEQYAAIKGGVARITPKVAPVIAVPTTAGTGSEVGRGSMVILESGRKLALLSPNLLPKSAICDPELTFDMPPGLTAATGMDAFAHCLETYLSPAINPPAEAIALDGLARVGRWIEVAVAEPRHREARWNMMMASMMGAMAFQKGLGAIHAMSHPLGQIPSLNLHHGTLNAVVAPTVIRFNAPHVGDKYQTVKRQLGLLPGTDLAKAVADLNRRLGLPAGLKAMGVTEAMLPAAAADAVTDHCNASNPVKGTEADYLRLMREAM
ncbi:MAG: iron-containing alcohol dehydrogenase [Alphaproteobacteria bacterium]|nr:iron-containing alcohol dehydrogenase [Alphaproteobacteria bacterium]